MSVLDTKKLDISKYNGSHSVVIRPKRPPRHRPGEKFLKGPIPLPWLYIAALLPGKTLAVSLAIWFRAGVTRNRTIRLTKRTRAHFNVGVKAASRCLKSLEDAGLVSVKRSPGRSPVVTILETLNGNGTD